MLKLKSSFVGHHMNATFELRAGSGVPDARIPARWGGGVVKAEARRVERSESLDDVEHSSILAVGWPTFPAQNHRRKRSQIAEDRPRVLVRRHM